MRILYLFLLLIMIGCSDEVQPDSFSANLDLPTEYKYTVTVSCYCTPDVGGPHRLHIRETEVIDYELLRDDIAPDPEQVPLLTIDALTARVDEIVALDPFQQRIELHPVYHFPQDVSFDIYENALDEEWGYIIDNFEVIQE